MGTSTSSGHRSSGVWNDCSAGAPLPSSMAARFAVLLVLLLVRRSFFDRLLRLVYVPRHLAFVEEAQDRTAKTEKSSGVDRITPGTQSAVDRLETPCRHRSLIHFQD